MQLAAIDGRFRWVDIADRITMAALLNEAMHTSKYDYDNIQDVPLDAIHVASALLKRDE